MNLNKYGPERIKYDLMVKGVSRDIIDKVLVVDRDEQTEMAKDAASKKMRSYRKDNKKDIYRKLSGFLQRKGFTYDVISTVVRETLDNMDEDEEFYD